MKKLTALLFCTAALLALCACGGKGNTLFEEASPSTSAMELQFFDGTEGMAGLLFDQADEKEILAELRKVRAKRVGDWSPKMVSYPVYGLRIGSADGEGIQAAWSGGYLLMRDGDVYKFDYDFSALSEKYKWEVLRDVSSAAELYNGRYLIEQNGAWYPIHMTPASLKDAPEDVSMTLTAAGWESLTAELTNYSGEGWCYGEYFSLQVRLYDEWYEVPTTPEHNWGFTDIGWILEPGQTQEKTYPLMMYGTLPEGYYRLVVNGLTAEFEIA